MLMYQTPSFALKPGVSQKVVNHRILPVLALLRLLLSAMYIILWRSVKDVEKSLASIADLKHTGKVPAPVAVVRCTPDRTQPVVIQDLIPLLAQLVRPEDMRHAIDLEEFPHHLRPEGIPGSTRRERKLISLGVRIRPHQIRHGALVRDLTKPVDDFNLIDRMDGWRKAAVYAEDLIVDHHAQGQKIEHVREIMPDVGIPVFPRAFSIEPVGLRDASGLMVSANKMDAVRIS